MVKKNKGEEGAERELKTGGKPSGSDNPYEQMLHTWEEYSKQMGSLVTNIMSTGKSKYGGLSERWMKFYEESANNMTKSMSSSNQAEIQVVTNVWKNYNNRLVNRMNKMIEDGNGAQTTIKKTWDAYAPKISEQLLRGTNGKGDTANPESLYKSWTDFTSRMSQDFAASVDKTWVDSQELLVMWRELDSEIRGLIGQFMTTNQDVYADLNKSWTETSEKMGSEINAMAEDYSNMFVNLRNSWLDYVSTMSKQFMDVTSTGGLRLEDVYKRYVDYTNEFFRMLNPAVAAMASSADSDVRELRKKVEDLERRLQKADSKA